MVNPSEPEKDIRIAATHKIWSYATGMLAICLIFAPASYSMILALAVVAGAAGTTVYIWHSDKKSKESLPPSQLQQIEERLANLETIASSNDWNLQIKLKQLESTHDNL